MAEFILTYFLQRERKDLFNMFDRDHFEVAFDVFGDFF